MIASAFKKLKKYNRVASDFSYSIFSSFLYTGIIQIVVYPLLARLIGAEKYGLLLTAMGIVNTVSMSFGNTLNNTRLIQNDKYINNGLEGDFNLLLIFGNLIGTFVIVLLGTFYITSDITTKILLILLVVVNISKSYFSVFYRITLNFRASLLVNIVSIVGYLIGLGIFYFIRLWPIIFICGEAIGLLFILFTTNLKNEKLGITRLMKITTMKYGFLIVSGFISSILLYLDRLMIYPTLGAESVSIYTVSSFFGKSLGLVMVPIAGVLLGYYAQTNFRITLKKYWRINQLVFLSTLAFFLASLVIANWVTNFLYPSIFAQAKPFIILANIAALINVANTMIDPIILKYTPTFWQVFAYLIYASLYLGLGILLISQYQILGLCFAAIIANSFKMCLFLILGTIYIRDVERFSNEIK